MHVSRGVPFWVCFSNKGVFPFKDAYVNGGVTFYGNVFINRGCSSLVTYRLAGVCSSPLVVHIVEGGSALGGGITCHLSDSCY